MASEGSISCGERLVQYLEAYGIDTVFGIPGNHTVQLYRGLEASSIRHISPRHEQGAAFMADGYARASGRPAACFLISGPGLGNAVTPMMQALADSVPMLVVTAVAARAHLGLGEGRLHEMPDQRAMASQCSRFSHTLMDPASLPKIVARAFAVFSSERPGPVHIEIPLDVITADASHVPLDPWPLPLPPAASAAGLRTLAERLGKAQAPTLVVGGGAAGAATAVRALAERRQMPVVNTINGKGILPIDHPLAVGASPSLAAVREFLHESDLVFAVGTEFGETDYDMLFLGDLPVLPWLARLDVDGAQLTRNQRPDLALVGDSRASLEALLELLPEASPAAAESAGERVRAVRKAVGQDPHCHREMDQLFSTIQRALPGLCLVGDSTLPTYHAVWQYEAEAPRRYFHSATGGGTLGYAIPAAIGARRVLGDEIPVAVLIGDGAAQFTFMELAAAVQEQLPVIVLLWNNEGYREIKKGMEASGVATIGVDVSAPDFVAAARALGCAAQQVTSLEALESALLAAADEERPTLLALPEASFLRDPGPGWYH